MSGESTGEEVLKTQVHCDRVRDVIQDDLRQAGPRRPIGGTSWAPSRDALKVINPALARDGPRATATPMAIKPKTIRLIAGDLRLTG
jgi:hypothetical protein